MANIKGIGKTVTLAQAPFSLLGYTFFDNMTQNNHNKKVRFKLNYPG